jgi:FkbM family methyltransferase
MTSVKRVLFECARRLPDFKGKHNVLRKLVSAVPSAKEFTIQSGGAAFSIGGVEINEFWMASKGIHSPEIFGKLCELAGDAHAVVWDIGANIGTLALPLLAAKPHIKVVAFEPSPEVCAKLLKNASLNPGLRDRLTIVNCALSDHTGWVKFYASNEISNSGVGGIGDAGNRVDLPFMIFAQLGANCLEMAPAPDIIKIDVEGYELAVLRGLQEILDKRPLNIVFEHSAYRLKDFGLPADAVIQFLEARGFKITALDGVAPISLEAEQDLLATGS